MEPEKKISNSLALRRIAALEKGEFKEDCVMISFLVGYEDSNVEEIRAWRYDLQVSSEYFQGLLRSPLTPSGPIRIKNVEPDIFKLLVEFTHTCGHLVTEVSDLEQCLKLSAAADEFLLDELGKLCTKKLEKLITLDNVWTVFSQNHLIKYSSAACEQLLSSKTEECLKKPAFLEIDEDTLAKFLSLKEMSINSEMQLVTACLKYIKGKVDERALFRRCALPHLRLLTLSADDLSELAPFLEKDEKMFLSLNLLGNDPLLLQSDLLDTKNLCLEPRSPFSSAALEKNLQKRLDFVLSESLGYGSKFIQENITYIREGENKLALIVEAHEFIKITGFDVLGHIDTALYQDTGVVTRMNNEQAVTWMAGTKAQITVLTSDEFSTKSEDLKPVKFSPLWAHFETNILVAKGGKCRVEVSFRNCCYFRKVMQAKDICGPEVTCSFQQIKSHYSTVQCDNIIFKCLHYENVL